MAKKLIAKGFPRRFDDWTMLPLMSLSEKGGAFAPALRAKPFDVPPLPAGFSLCVHRESGRAVADTRTRTPASRRGFFLMSEPPCGIRSPG